MDKAENQIVVYQPNETVRLDVRLENETVWLTQAQLCELFQRDVSVISRHIKNIFAEGELEKESNLHFLQIANSDRVAERPWQEVFCIHEVGRGRNPPHQEGGVHAVTP